MRSVGLVCATLLLFCATKAQSSGACPSISVTGPAGIVEPGRTVHFSVSLEPEEASRPLGFEWTVSGGAILGRQDTRALEVRPEKYFNKETTATVLVRGLPDGCAGTARESFIVVCDPYLVISGEVSFWTQYSEVSWQEERESLDSVVLDGLKSRPRQVIYLEKTFGNGASQKDVDTQIRRIRNYLNKVRRIPRDGFFIRTSRGDRAQTNVYLVPRDAPVLNSNYLDPCLQ